MATPDRGDVVWLNFHPQIGREQSGRRPALILSPRRYHQLTQYIVVCPITSAVKEDYPYAVRLPDHAPVSGYILADQVKNQDRHGRNWEYIGTLPYELVCEVQEKIAVLLGIDQLYIQS